MADTCFQPVGPVQSSPRSHSTCLQAIDNGHGPEGEVDYGHDLWSLGAVLLQLLSGVVTFHARSEYLTFERVREVPCILNFHNIDKNNFLLLFYFH